VNRPFLGDVRESWQTYVCGFVLSPDDLHCDLDAAWHGFTVDDDGIEAMMACCDEHLPQMKQAADYVHALEHPCGIPGSMFRWPENECYTDWDEASEFAAALESAGTR
jgi:hypothetical protein